MCTLCPPQDIEALLSGMSRDMSGGATPHNLPRTSTDTSHHQGVTEDSSSSSMVQSGDPVASTSSANPCTSSTTTVPEAASSTLSSTSPFTTVPVMKPDIVFFGEGLPDLFHTVSLTWSCWVIVTP